MSGATDTPNTPNTSNVKAATGNVVWSARPSIGVYVALYGILALIVAAILVGLEVYTADSFSAVRSLFFASMKIGSLTIPDVLEVATILVILIAYLIKALELVIYKARNSYELHTDGLYINKGIANLQNTFISAMAFSDARLVRTIGMRIVGRSMIVVEANDGRKFEMKMLKEGLSVQELVRSNLSHPTVRLEK
jgi:hypothetical protein